MTAKAARNDIRAIDICVESNAPSFYMQMICMCYTVEMNAPLLLRAAKLRVTPKRIRLLEVLHDAGRPLSVDVLHGKVKDVDLATVYRTMETFVRVGLLREVRFRDAIVRYEFAHGHHHHLVCTDCGVVEEIDACEVAPLENKVLKHSRRFKTISEHALEFFGLCKKCA